MPDELADAEDPFFSSLIQQISELEESSPRPQDAPPRQPAATKAPPETLPREPEPAEEPVLRHPPAPEEFAPAFEADAEFGQATIEPQAQEHPVPMAPRVDDVLDLGEPLPLDAALAEPGLAPAPAPVPEPPPVTGVEALEAIEPVEPVVAPEVALESLDETLAEEVEDLLGGGLGAVDDLPTLADAPAAVSSAPHDPMQELAEAAVPASLPPPAAPARGGRQWSALVKVVQRAGHVLDAVGAPVRALPPSARLVVDFLALSLLLWVPLVWLIALFVIGK